MPSVVPLPSQVTSVNELQPIILTHILILSSQLRLNPPSLFHSVCQTKTVCISDLPHACYLSSSCHILFQGCPTLPVRGPQPLLCARLRAARVKTTSVTPKLIQYCAILTAHTSFTNVAKRAVRSTTTMLGPHSNKYGTYLCLPRPRRVQLRHLD